MGYETVVRYLKRLPMTWYPALLEVMICAAIDKGVFLEGKVGSFAEGIERRYRAELAGKAKR